MNHNNQQPGSADDLDHIHAFLLGEKPINGLWFGDLPGAGHEGGKFWWRRQLRDAIAASRRTAGGDVLEQAAKLAIKFTAVPRDVLGPATPHMKAMAAVGEKLADEIRALAPASLPDVVMPGPWKVLADDDTPDASRLLDVILHNGVGFTNRVYSRIDWTQVANWRYSAAQPTEGSAATCSGCDPAEGFCKVCRDAEKRAAEGSAQVAKCDALNLGLAEVTIEQLKSRLTQADECILRLEAQLREAPERSDTPAGLLAEAIAKAAIKRGIIAPGTPLTGPQLVMLCDDLATPIAASKALDAAAPAGLTDAARDVLAERRRQVEQEGWTPEHDDQYDTGELSCAAACYAMQSDVDFGPPNEWPWSRDWWKPDGERRNLVKAGALILADIERMDRARIDGDKQGAQGEKA